MEIGESAFSGCISITDLELPEGIITLYSEAFSDCYALKTVTIPSTMGIICERVFENCSELEEILFNGTKEEWEEIELNDDWNKGIKALAVKCTNGYVWF